MPDPFGEVPAGADAERARLCRVCGCGDDTPCLDRNGCPCAWVADDLCSACLSQEAWVQLMPPEAVAAAAVLNETIAAYEAIDGPLGPTAQKTAAFFFAQGYAAHAGLSDGLAEARARGFEIDEPERTILLPGKDF